MPPYSLVELIDGVKDGLNLQDLLVTEFVPTQNLSIAYDGKQGVYVRYTSETGTTET